MFYSVGFAFCAFLLRWPSYQRLNGVSNFHDIRYRHFLRQADERLEFHASELSDSYTSLGAGLKNVYPYFSYFLIGTRNLHVMRVSTCEYHENRHSKSHTLLHGVNAAYRNFLRFPSYLHFDTGDNHKKYLVILGCVKIGPLKAIL